MFKAPPTHGLAIPDDLPVLRALMVLSIRKPIGALLDAERMEAAFEIMGVDSQRIADGTYFVMEQGVQIIGCGGWSRRTTLFGGNHSGGRGARLLDPATEPARVRAMYTQPEHARQGIGRLILSLCERAARGESFRAMELVATFAGEPLYAACGDALIERIEVPTSTGLKIPCARMGKPLLVWDGIELPQHGDRTGQPFGPR